MSFESISFKKIVPIALYYVTFVFVVTAISMYVTSYLSNVLAH